MDIMVEKTGWRHNAAGIWIFTVILAAISVVFLSLSVARGIEYNRVMPSAPTVEAEAYEYREVDDEGDTDYRVYVRFAYEGKNYSVGYATHEDRDKAEAMLGKTVKLHINPENPVEQIEDIQGNMVMFAFTSLPFWLFAVILLFERKRNLYIDTYGFKTEYIQIDLKRQLLFNAAFWVAFLSGSIVLLVLWIFFPLVFRNGWIGTVFGAVISVLLYLRWRKDVRRVREGQYYRSHQTVYDMKIDSGGDSTTYDLYLTNGVHQWRKQVSKKKFNATDIGDTAQTVFLQGDSQPFLSAHILE